MRRRAFLRQLGEVAGAGAVYRGMTALGLLPVPAPAAFGLSGRGDGRTVLILGAGLAGMTVAHELGKLGYDCRILEARDRVGGRCWTVRRGSHHTDVHGRSERCEFDDGLYFNPGPMRIPSNHATTLDYCRQFGIPLEPFVFVNENAWVFAERGGLGRVRVREVRADLRGYVDELLAKAVRQGALDQELGAEDREALLDLLRSDGWLTKELRYDGPGARRGYAEPRGFGEAKGRVAPPLDRGTLLRSRVGEVFTWEQYVDFQDTLLEIPGGTDRLAQAFAERLPGRITLGAEVTEIRRQGDGVRVVYRDADRVRREATAEFCVCTLPLPVLRQVSADLPRPVRKAVERASYAHSGKVALQMKRRFWEEDDRIYGGVTRTDLPIEQIYYPSNGWQSAKGVLIGAYNYDEFADRFAALSPEERIRLALEQGGRIHPQYAAEFEAGFSTYWQVEPHTLGGWAQWEDSPEEDYHAVVGLDGPVWLCGEHTSHLTSWMAGAFESGRAVATAIHQRASRTSPPAPSGD